MPEGAESDYPQSSEPEGRRLAAPAASALEPELPTDPAPDPGSGLGQLLGGALVSNWQRLVPRAAHWSQLLERKIDGFPREPQGASLDRCSRVRTRRAALGPGQIPAVSRHRPRAKPWPARTKARIGP